MKFDSIEELLEFTEKIKNKTFKEIDSKNLLESSNLRQRKGLLGNVVETGFYKYPANSDAKADFDEIGVELKVSGYLRNKNGTRRAKERLVLSKIDYNKIVEEEFEFSKLISKNKNILLIWYEYDKEKNPEDFIITDFQLYDMEQDLEIIKNDFNTIKNKVNEGYAHELSESDTAFLGACTKARTSADRTSQPNSPIPAKPRAFSLKQGYINGILKNLSENKTTDKTSKQVTIVTDKTNQQKPKIITKVKQLPSKQDLTKDTLNKLTDSYKIPNTKDEEPKTVLEFINLKFKDYFGKTQVEIYKELFGEIPEKIPYQLNKMISDNILGKDSELKENNELFKKTNYLIKNLPITDKNKARERMAFKNLRLSEFEDEWDDSYWKNFFEENTLVTICYEGKSSSKNGERVLKKVMQITFDDEELDSIEKTFNLVKQTIEDQDISKLPTPGSFDGQILEIAPKASKGKNIYETFLDNERTKVCFMLNKKFLNKKLSEYEEKKNKKPQKTHI